MTKKTFLLVAGITGVAGHGAMISPAPRSAHGQTLDAANKCGSANPYSKAGLRPGEYCGNGCLGDACLYYQVGCYAGCGTCSLTGKDLYPTAADLAKAGNCKPIEPTLGGGDPAHEYELRTMNIDNLSVMGDWTRPNPWRAPGSAGLALPTFEPCGVNSGGSATGGLPPTTAQDVPTGGPGTSLPDLGSVATWAAGSVVNASWAIYANHGGGYSYRVCKKGADKSAPTEACFQQTPLDFVGSETTVVYTDGSRAPFTIPAVQTNKGTHPTGSMWRKNPVPMCNCDVGIGCGGKRADVAQPKVDAADAAAAAFRNAMVGGGKECVPDPTCSGTVKTELPGCKKCDTSLAPWSCAKDACCSGYTSVAIDGGYYCSNKGPKSPTPAPAPNPMFETYNVTHFHKGQTSEICPTGVQYETMWDEGMGASGENNGKAASDFGQFNYYFVDQLKVPSDLTAGEYTLSWRWDCEETPQVWNSCADITITA